MHCTWQLVSGKGELQKRREVSQRQWDGACTKKETGNGILTRKTKSWNDGPHVTACKALTLLIVHMVMPHVSRNFRSSTAEVYKSYDKVPIFPTNETYSLHVSRYPDGTIFYLSVVLILDRKKLSINHWNLDQVYFLGDKCNWAQVISLKNILYKFRYNQ